MKDKVESVVEDVEETIGSALGTVKDKTDEGMDDAKEALDQLEQSVVETADNAVDEAEKEMDTMVEDLEESLPQPARSDSQAKDFQMDTLDVRPQSQASTARLSRKSGEDEEIKRESPFMGGESTIENSGMESDLLNSPKDQSVKSLNVENEQNELETQKNEEFNDNGDISRESQSKSRASKKSTSRAGSVSLSRQGSRTSNSIQYNETIIEPEIDTPVSAIPVDREDSPEDKSLVEEGEKEGLKSPLTVELPQEEKDEKTATPSNNSRSGSEILHSPTPVAESSNSRPGSEIQNSPTPVAETGNSRPTSEVHHTPTPIPPPTSPPRLQSPHERAADLEAYMEATNIPQQENQPDSVNDIQDAVDSQENKSPSPSGKNDSAISSSSSVSSEPQGEDQPVEERQETPVIEAA